MNRRRIGLAALVVGAGAMVRRRLRTRADPGDVQNVDSASPATDTATASEQNVVGIEAPLITDAVLGDPEIELPAAEPDDPEIELPAAEPDDLPRIVLPTMPQAGTHDVASDPKSMSRTAEPTANVAPAVFPADNAVVAEPSTTSETTQQAAAESPRFTVPPPRQPQEGGAAAPYSRRRWSGWSIFGTVVGALVVAAVIAASVVRLPYYTIRPGSVYDTIELVEAPGDLVSIPTGHIGFVTVSQTANISPWQWLDAKLDSNVRILSEDEVQGDQTADELREADIRRMQVSKDSAVVVALSKLGYDLVITPLGIEVAQVFPCTAADGTLGTGDLIVGVDGAEVLDGEQLVAALANVAVGDEIELLVERIDPANPTQSTHTDLVNLMVGSADDACLSEDIRADEPRAFIGIGTLTIYDEEFPIDIDVRTGSVSGPSAGLAFTLAIIDVLSEGELTNGLNIVATGTIDRDGNVGPVGGIQQKTITAERSGADVFIVPNCCDNFVDATSGELLGTPSNYEEAVEYADDMIVIGVDTLDEALQAIGELGGDVDQFLS